jgi:predicted DsbA family dithiol-disulfide isomerase
MQQCEIRHASPPNPAFYKENTIMKIDFVSDIACPWCAVGLNALEIALQRIGNEIPVSLHMQPFELNPDMTIEGVDAAEYLSQKYGLSAAQLAANRANIRARGDAVGFAFGERSRVWNTFDAHRLLHWAGLQDANKQRALKHALLHAYHGEGRNPASKEVLCELANTVGLDAAAAKGIVESDVYTREVREAEQFWIRNGINSVPAVIIDDKHLISGGQPPEVFEQALRQIAAEAKPAAM